MGLIQDQVVLLMLDPKEKKTVFLLMLHTPIKTGAYPFFMFQVLIKNNLAVHYFRLSTLNNQISRDS